MHRLYSCPCAFRIILIARSSGQQAAGLGWNPDSSGLTVHVAASHCPSGKHREDQLFPTSSILLTSCSRLPHMHTPLRAGNGVFCAFCILFSTHFLVGHAQVSANPGGLSMDWLTTLLSLSPFDLEQLENDTKLPSPCLQLPLDNPPLSQKKKKKRQLQGYRELQRVSDLSEANNHLLPLEWVIWIFFLTYLSSLFAVKTQVCALNPAQRIMSGQKEITMVCESSQADTWGMSTLSQKDHRVWVQNQVLVPALWSCKPSEPPCILHRVAVRMKWDFLCKRNLLLFLDDQGPPAQNFSSWLPVQPQHTCDALDLESGCSSQLSSLPLPLFFGRLFLPHCLANAYWLPVHSTDGCLLSIHCVPITVTGTGDTMVN